MKIKKFAHVDKSFFIKKIILAIKINNNINKFLIYKKIVIILI